MDFRRRVGRRAQTGGGFREWLGLPLSGWRQRLGVGWRRASRMLEIRCLFGGWEQTGDRACLWHCFHFDEFGSILGAQSAQQRLQPHFHRLLRGWKQTSCVGLRRRNLRLAIDTGTVVEHFVCGQRLRPVLANACHAFRVAGEHRVDHDQLDERDKPTCTESHQPAKSSDRVAPCRPSLLPAQTLKGPAIR